MTDDYGPYRDPQIPLHKWIRDLPEQTDECIATALLERLGAFAALMTLPDRECRRLRGAERSH